MRAVLAASQNDRRAGDAWMEIVPFRLGQCLELIDDRLHVGMLISLGEHIGKEMCQWSRTERRAQILESVAPAIVDALLLVGGDAMLGELPPGIIPGAREHQRRSTLRLLVMHIRQ